MRARIATLIKVMSEKTAVEMVEGLETLANNHINPEL